MMSVPARQPPQNQGDAAGACTYSAESGAGSGSIAVQAVLATNKADANDAAQYISVPAAESGGGNDGHAVASPVQPPLSPPPPPQGGESFLQRLE
jgi:hypothetical protein